MGRFRRGAVVGVTLALTCATGGTAAAAELVANGSFEEPDIPTGSFGIFASIPGWSHEARPGTTSSGIELQDHVAGAPEPGFGDQFVELDSDGPSRIFQDVATSPGSTYRLSFRWSPRRLTLAAENHFSASAGDETMVVGPAAGAPANIWQGATLDFVASASSSRIAFLDLGPEQGTGGVGAYVDGVSVVLVNTPPDCSSVTATPDTLWPPNNGLRAVTLAGASDPDGDAVVIAVTGVTQDEAVGDAPDAAAGDSPGEVRLRAQRDGGGDGRVYRVSYTATDPSGASCSGTATVDVPHDSSGRPVVDSGAAHDSFGS